MKERQAPTAHDDRGSQSHASNDHVHPLFTGILRPFMPDVKGDGREDGADLAFDSSKKERWS